MYLEACLKYGPFILKYMCVSSPIAVSQGEGCHSPSIVLNIYAEMAINFVINSFIISNL